MNETPLHEPLIAEEGKEKERVFTGTPERIVNICLASISALIIYWTVYVSADVMWKHGLYIMTVFCMTLVIYPFEKKPKVNHVSLVDWLLIIGSIAGSAYAIWEYLDRFMRLGMLTEMDIFFGCLMLFLGLEVGRRVIGWSLTLVSIVLILYSLYGFVIPGHFGHGGFDLEAVVTQVYAGMEGYYGLSAKMMIQYVAPFILMGAFLEKSGAGDFFIRLAFALTRNTVGGPAKAAVIGSALLGSISGSAVANVSSTGVLTIPMMKKVGYRPHVAGAIEAAASTGGQIMPPIMGAAAFLMAEYMGVTYGQVTLWAILPAVLYFGGIFISVHLEAKKLGLKGIPRSELPRFKYLIRNVYLLLPLVFLIWMVTANIRSLQFSAAIAILISIAVSLAGTIRDASAEVKETKTGSVAGITAKKTGRMILDSLEAGGKGSITVAVACAMAGMIAGCITVTGLASKLISGVIAISSAIPNPTLSLLLALFLTMLCCIVLGMGVPTTANYCIMASTCAPILITLGIPKVAAHFFVFYFGIVADITPPVALAAYAGSAIAKSDPMKTGINATKLAIAAFIVPYIFAMNPSMLLMDQGVLAAVQVIITSCLGIFSIAAALEGYIVTHAPWWQRILLAAGGLCLIDPKLTTDFVGVAAIVVVIVLQIVLRKPSRSAAA